VRIALLCPKSWTLHGENAKLAIYKDIDRQFRHFAKKLIRERNARTRHAGSLSDIAFRGKGGWSQRDIRAVVCVRVDVPNIRRGRVVGE